MPAFSAGLFFCFFWFRGISYKVKKAPATFEVTGVCNGLKFNGLVWYNDINKLVITEMVV